MFAEKKLILNKLKFEINLCTLWQSCMGHQADPTEAEHFLEESLSLQSQDFEDSGWSLQPTEQQQTKSWNKTFSRNGPILNLYKQT